VFSRAHGPDRDSLHRAPPRRKGGVASAGARWANDTEAAMSALAAIEPSFQMWATFGLIAVGLGFYMVERVPMELTSLGILCAALLLFHFAPVPDAAGRNLLGATRLLEGFANPALIAILALLVVGDGLVRTGTLDQAAGVLVRMGRGEPTRATAIVLLVVTAISAVLNNIPVVVIFVPIMQLLARHMGRTPSALMMPLSFAAMLGGSLTLIGSSTNLLVSGTLTEIGERPLGFFEFTLPGLVLCAIGFVYVLAVAPRLLPERRGLETRLMPGGKQFVAQITLAEGSRLLGLEPVGGFFPTLKDITVRMIQRGEQALFPPFEEIALEPGDVLVVAATRQALTDAARADPFLLHPVLPADRMAEADGESPWRKGAQMLAEVMVTPSSRMLGQTLEQIGFRYQHGCIVLGIQRRARMIRERVTTMRLEPGDVLLIQGPREHVDALRANPDVLLIAWSAADLPATHHTRIAGLIFLGVVVAAASARVPIVVAALVGAAAMVGFGVLNIRQAARAIDRKIVLIIPAALALSAALYETGGAAYLSHVGIAALHGAAPAVFLSALYLVVALLSNVLSNKATAVLFTPIGGDLRRQCGVRLAGRLSDEPVGDGAGVLPVHRLHPRRPTVDPAALAGVLAVRALVLRPGLRAFECIG
jgi:di/tricarboxylate transporter